MVAWGARQLDYLPIRIFLWIVAALFAFGGTVHVQNILSLSGYAWSESPPAWQIFDIVFLALDLAVVIGVLARRGWGVIAFIAAAGLQVAIYQFFPEAFAASPEQFEIVARLRTFALGLLAIFGLLVVLGAWNGKT